MDPDSIARSLRGNIHVTRSADGRVSPAHFTEWVTSRVQSDTFTVIASAAAGTRLSLTTASQVVWLGVFTERVSYDPVPPSLRFTAIAGGERWPDVVVPGDAGRVLFVDEADQITEFRGAPSVVRFERPPHADSLDLDIFLPADAALTIESLSGDEPILPRAVAPRRRWLHHGSSISHGGHLADSRLAWPLLAADELELDVFNASLPGNCLLDPCVAQELAAVPAELYSLELGINVVNWDSHIERTFIPAVHHVLDCFAASSSAPLFLVSPFFSGMFEENAGPVEIDATGGFGPASHPRAEALTTARVRELLVDVIGNRPPGTVVPIDGLRLLGPAEAETLVDGLHPDEIGMRMIAQRFVETVRPHLPA